MKTQTAKTQANPIEIAVCVQVRAKLRNNISQTPDDARFLPVEGGLFSCVKTAWKQSDTIKHFHRFWVYLGRFSSLLVAFCYDRVEIRHQEELMTAKDVVYSLGIPGSYLGHHCLVIGVELVVANPNFIFKATKNLYPEIARRLNSTPINVERNIRTVIQICWNNGNLDFLNKIARYPLSVPPRPVDLIDMIAAYLECEGSKLSI